MAVFGVPQVHEDDALRAVRAAIELRDAVNVAARLEQAASAGEALIGAETYGLAATRSRRSPSHRWR